VGTEEDKTAAIAGLRAALRQHGRALDAEVIQQMDALLVQAGDARGWKPQAVDAEREALIAKAKGLVDRPEGQTLGGRKVQETLRQLREQWKLLDQGAVPNHGCGSSSMKPATPPTSWSKAGWTAAHRIGPAQGVAHHADRGTACLGQSVKDSKDWKGMARSLRQFSERWREGGHVGEKLYAELQQQWRQAINEAEAPLQQAQKDSLQRRQAMIEEAQALGAARPCRSQPSRRCSNAGRPKPRKCRWTAARNRSCGMPSASRWTRLSAASRPSAVSAAAVPSIWNRSAPTTVRCWKPRSSWKPPMPKAMRRRSAPP
jgi:cellobiose-specific phosphotransferase system component IIA